MTVRRRCWPIGVLALVACHHAPPGASAPDAQAELARARRQFRHGDFAHATVALKRLTFQLSPTQPEMAEVRYDLAECYFQTGDRVQAAHEFRQVADQYPNSAYAPLALLRAGDANLRLWRSPELDPSYGETALAIFAYTRERLAPYKRVRRLEFADLPKTISGKIRRVELRAQETARHSGDAAPGPRGVTEFWEEDFRHG